MPRCVVRRTFASGSGDSETILRSVERRVSEGQPERFGAAASARLGKGIGAGGGDRGGRGPRSDIRGPMEPRGELVGGWGRVKLGKTAVRS